MLAKLSSPRLISSLISKSRLHTNHVNYLDFSPKYHKEIPYLAFNNVNTQICSFSNSTTSSKKTSQEKIELENDQLEKEEKRVLQKKITKYTLFGIIAAFSGSALYAFITWGKPQVDENGVDILDQFSEMSFFIQYTSRAWNTFLHYEKVLKEPTRELLLPPPMSPPYFQPPYTLVLEMTGVMIHPVWTYRDGWHFKKRPFVDYFLHQCATSTNFEIVIYTREQGFTALPILNSLDPNGYIMYRLFRDSTRYENGVHIKDLNCLNRDLKNVIHIDCDPKACELNKDNCLTIKKWEGDSEDRTFYDLTNFLLAISTEKVEDVRQVIRYYSQFDDPLAVFRENQRKLAEYEKEKKEALDKQNKSLYKSFLDSFKK